MDYLYSWCSECGDPLPEAIKLQLPRVREEIAARESPTQVPLERSIGPEDLAKRYLDAYQVARVTVGAGSGVKTVGVIVAILVALASLVEQDYLLGGMFVALVLGISFYVAGTMISAQGQLLRANTDSAINTSPLLDNEQKAKILALGQDI